MKLLSFRVLRRIDETSDSCSFVLSPLDNQSIDYQSGQYLSVQIPLASGAIFRAYSFSSSPLTDETPRITVKREPGGRGSNWLCDHLKEGDLVKALPPAGDFVPSDLRKHLLLIAGGSGITPLISILKSALLKGSPSVRLVYASRSADQAILQQELKEWRSRYPEQLEIYHWLDDQQGPPDVRQLQGCLYADRFQAAFICGPARFMDLAQQALEAAKFPADRISIESFTSTTNGTIPDADGGPAMVKGDDGALIVVQHGGREYEVSCGPDEHLLSAMIAQGLNVPSSCRAGNCGTCLCTLAEGSAILDDNNVLDDEDEEEGWILACRARPKSSRLRIVFP